MIKGDQEVSSDLGEYQVDEEIVELEYSSRRKRRKLTSSDAAAHAEPRISLQPLIDLFGGDDNANGSFDEVIDRLLPEYFRSRAVLRNQEAELDQHGQKVRPLSRSEVLSFLKVPAPEDQYPTNLLETITKSRLRVTREKRYNKLREMTAQTSGAISRLPPAANFQEHPQVTDALYSIQTTPFRSSFLSRLHGTVTQPLGVLAMDWVTASPWMKLMGDIREHYALAHPTREHAVETLGPIAYVSLQPYHLHQVHDLLERSFWSGINVSDSFDHIPERCTVVATYKRLVVGVAILSSPRETYITYLAVRAGWENAGIARSMLYHLIMLNPNKDITLHVSVNSSAMLLYNRFGFKAEEFVAGFYEDYLDPQSRASKNAFRLRLRQ